MKVNFDSHRQQSFTAYSNKNQFAENVINKMITECAGIESTQNHFPERNGAAILRNWFNKHIVEPLAKVDGDMQFDGEKLLCRWMENGEPKLTIIPVPLEQGKLPKISEESNNIIRYYTLNPFIVGQKPTKNPIQLFKKWLSKDPTIEHSITYKKSQNQRSTVGRELELTPTWFHPFIVGRELMQAGATKSEKVPEHLKGIYVTA